MYIDYVILIIYKCQTAMLNKIVVQLGNKSDIFLEISSITNVSSIRIYILELQWVILLNFP